MNCKAFGAYLGEEHRGSAIRSDMANEPHAPFRTVWVFYKIAALHVVHLENLSLIPVVWSSHRDMSIAAATA